MVTSPSWERVRCLTDKAAGISEGAELHFENYWPAIVASGLVQGNERLRAAQVLLNHGYLESAGIITRSLFELAANICYLEKDSPSRVPKYLEHGGFPLSEEQAQKLRDTLSQKQLPSVKDLVPGGSWIPLKCLCDDLGPVWINEYGTFYRFTSVHSHAGSFTFGKRLIDSATKQPLLDREKIAVQITALEFNVRITAIGAKIFPQQIKLDLVNEVAAEIREIGDALVSR